MSRRVPLSRSAGWAGLLVVVALLVLTGCQMQVAVDVTVKGDGSGEVRVGVGLDDSARDRAGDLDQVLQVDDLRAAGWTVAPARTDAEGITWVDATKPFGDPTEFAAVMDELTGSQGVFEDFELTRSSGLLGTTAKVTGTVDLLGGPAAFGDPELTEALGGDPFGGTLISIEQAEGRPAADLVSFVVRIDLPGASEPTVYTPSFHDAAPTSVDASATQGSLISQLWIWALVAMTVAVGLFVWRSGFTRVRR